MPQGKIWDSVTNIIALLFVVSLIAFVALGINMPDIFVASVSLVLGAFFQKNGQKDGQAAAVQVAEETKKK